MGYRPLRVQPRGVNRSMACAATPAVRRVPPSSPLPFRCRFLELPFLDLREQGANPHSTRRCRRQSPPCAEQLSHLPRHAGVCDCTASRHTSRAGSFARWFRQALEVHFGRRCFAELYAMLRRASDFNLSPKWCAIPVGFGNCLRLLVFARRESPFRIRHHVCVPPCSYNSGRCTRSE